MNWQALTPDLAIYPTFTNLLLKGCDPCFARYQVQGEKVVIYLATIKQLKVTLTKSSPERSGYMHIDKQVTLSILIMLVPREAPKTTRVEGLWLANRHKCLVLKHPDDSPKFQSCFPFIVPSLCSTRDPHDIILRCHDHLL